MNKVTVPNSWGWAKIGQVADIILSSVDKKSKEGEVAIRLCNYLDVFNNIYITGDMPFMKATATPQEIARYSLQLHDVVITKDSETAEDIARTAVVVEELKDVVCGYHLAIVRPNNAAIFGPYLRDVLELPAVHHQFVKFANGVTRFGLTLNAIYNTAIPLPPLPEQRAIAAILSTWDEAIQLTERLIAALQERKRGLMQRLLTGEVRFAEFEGEEWREVELAEVVVPVTRQEPVAPEKEYRLIGVRLYVAGAHIHEILPGYAIETTHLSRVHENDILYNKMWATKAAFAVARAEHHGAYGTAEYPQFTAQEDMLNVDFLGFLFHDARFQYDAARLCRGTTGRARLNPSDFLRIKIRLPGLREQTEIADVLQTCEQEISAFARKLEALKTQKKGLMQRLLTGEIRVQVDGTP